MVIEEWKASLTSESYCVKICFIEVAMSANVYTTFSFINNFFDSVSSISVFNSEPETIVACNYINHIIISSACQCHHILVIFYLKGCGK